MMIKMAVFNLRMINIVNDGEMRARVAYSRYTLT